MQRALQFSPFIICLWGRKLTSPSSFSAFFYAASLLTVIIFMQIVLKTEAEAESFALQALRCGIQQRGESEKAEKTLPEMKFLQHGNEHYF